MADWQQLRLRLAIVEDRVSLSWAELDDLVGGLPPSAHKFPTFWAGNRAQWLGFRTTNVRVGEQVTFVRRAVSPQSAAPRLAPRGPVAGRPDLVLIGCVKSKLDHPAQAKDLYTSALFRKERAYAEASGQPWFILSAQHGLVSPDEVIEPYDVYLKTTPESYRRHWGSLVLDQMRGACGPLSGKAIEIHASEAYVDALRSGLQEAGATVLEPLAGLRMGERQHWYDTGGGAGGDVAAILARLVCFDDALRPGEFVAMGGVGLQHPGLYSWWVDHVGAATLSAGLGHQILPGIIYAGLAGATHTRSGKESSNTLWGRIGSMHLGGRHEFSTFRRSLGSILASALLAPGIDEAALTAWMYEHLRVVAVPVADADTLDELETTVLAELDPPLNLMKVPKTPVRRRLSELRRQYGGAGREQ